MLKEKKRKTVVYKKLIFSILVVALLNLLGCYSNAILSPDQCQEIKEESSKADEVIINLKNGEKYKFAKGYYYINNDSLTGKGFAIKNESEEHYNGKIPLSQIKSIQFYKVDGGKTILLVAVITTGVLRLIDVLPIRIPIM